MRYRNKITGIEITTNSAISGPDYEEIKPKVEPVAQKTTKTGKKVESKRAKK